MCVCVCACVRVVYLQAKVHEYVHVSGVLCCGLDPGPAWWWLYGEGVYLRPPSVPPSVPPLILLLPTKETP